MRGSNSIKVVLPAVLRSRNLQKLYEKPYREYVSSPNFVEFDFSLINYLDASQTEVGNPYKYLPTVGAELLEEALKCPELFGYMKEQAYFVLMNHFYQKRNLDKCIEYAKKAIADTTLNKNVTTSAKFYNTQCTLDQAKYEEAQKLITEYAPDMQSDYYKARFAYIQALIHARNTEYEDAIKQFELVIKHEPKGWRAVQATKQIKRLQNL
jgi:tetratricopeptide (TPR) repeat protein